MWETWSDLVKDMPPGAFLQALSLPLSMLVALLVVRFTTNNQRELMITQEMCKLLNELGDASRELKNLYEQHYRGEHPAAFSGKVVKASQQKIQSHVRNLDLKRGVISSYLSGKACKRLQDAMDTWLDKIESDEFPVYRKADVFAADHAHFELMHTAQCTFESALAKCKQDLLRRVIF